jgi:hypothetical protein
VRWRSLLVLALATSLVAACGDDDAATDATTTTTEAVTTTETTEATTTTEAAAPTPAAAQVTLLDPGAEPRQELRYRPTEGTTDAVTQRNQLTLVQEFGGQRQEVQVPASSVDVDYVVEEVVDGGFTTVGTYGATQVEGDDAAAAETARLLEQISGAQLVTEMTDRGAITATRIEGIADTGNPMFGQLLGSLVDSAASLAFPFPEEAVGVGARWLVETEVEISGLPISARYEVTLAELDGDRVGADIAASLEFVPGPVVVQGTSAEVESGQLDGTGTVTWDLAGGLVPRTTLDMAGTVSLEVQGMRVVQEQTQRTEVLTR